MNINSISSDFTENFVIEEKGELICSKGKLRVEKATPEMILHLTKIVAMWERVAEEKCNIARIPSYNCASMFSKAVINTFSNEADLFSANSYIASIIAFYLKDFSNACDLDVYICKDLDGRVMGAMILSDVDTNDDEIYIEYLMTNPINIRSFINDRELHQVAGAGSLLLQAAEKVSLAGGKDYVILSPLAGAVNFYFKNGYEFDDCEFSMLKKVGNIYRMYLWGLTA